VCVCVRVYGGIALTLIIAPQLKSHVPLLLIVSCVQVMYLWEPKLV
jgi:hypothetical protein